MQSPADTQPRSHLLPLTILLTICYFILRLPNLRDMPAFTDETTYTRWAQIILDDPLHHLFVSMEDAKLPLHYWLLALTRPLAADPILAGRLLSVLLGALTIPATLLFARELWIGGGQLHPNANSNPNLFPALLGALLITNPLIALNQRVALAEPLLLLEAVTVAWLSLRLARLITHDAPRPVLLRAALLLSAAWTFLLITKQNSSYALWILPPTALLIHSNKAQFTAHLRRFLPLYALATLLALVLFIPFLFSDYTQDLHTRIFYKPIFQNHTTISNWIIAKENLTSLLSPRSDLHAQWWPHDPAHPLEEGWFYLYLTPPLFFLAPIGLAWMAHRRQWQPLLFVGIWSGSQLIPLVAVAGILFSRYTFLGFFPLLIPPAWLLADLLPRLRIQLPRLVYAPAAALAIVAVLAWPTFVSAWSAVNWRAPTLTVSDDTQFLTKFPSGTSTEQAIDWLQQAAKRQPITIIVGHWVGHPNDMLYLAFDHNPNVQLLHWLDNQYPLHPLAGRPNTYNLSDDRWLDPHIRPITLDPSRPTYILSPALREEDTNLMGPYLRLNKLPPGTHLVTLFENTPIAKTHTVMAELRLLQIPVNAAATIAQR